MKIIKKILLVLLVVFLAMQFYRPQKNVSDTVPATDLLLVEQPPAELVGIFKAACYDCHSNNTKYPWYNHIAPVSFLLADHVKEGKKHLNFSEWESYSAKKKAHKMEECIEEVKERHMPMESYVWMHPEAKLTDAQIAMLTEWAATLQLKYELAAQ